jgi:RNA polymerase sigma factor (sigma-70 family)
MNNDPLDALLVTLGGGDEVAAEEAFRAYEPLLRMLVRRRLAPKLRARFDSVDVVQSVWADVLEGLRARRWRFDDADHLRGFLVSLTSHRLVDRVRQHQSALKYEQVGPAGGRAAPPSPSEVAEAGELWERMLAACPPAHRELLELRREGLTTAEIAARVGLHEGSVRRALGDLARRLAVRAGGPGPA